jgi:hypothetical protein
MDITLETILRFERLRDQQSLNGNTYRLQSEHNRNKLPQQIQMYSSNSIMLKAWPVYTVLADIRLFPPERSTFFALSHHSKVR